MEPVSMLTKNISLVSFAENKVAKVPFQIYLEKAVDALQDVSNIEYENNNLVNDYLAGKASVDQVMVSTNQLTLAVSLASSVINTAVQTFKEIQQMSV